jgi:hypothetical protein
MLTLTALLSASVLGQDQISSFMSCASPDDLLQLGTAVVSPNPIIKGQPSTITISGTLKEPIQHGTTIRDTFKYGFLTVKDETLDLCQETLKEGRECSVDAGPWNQTKHFTIPSWSPGVHCIIRASMMRQ